MVIKVNEKTRKYHFPNTTQIILKDVREVRITKTNTHYLATADGIKHIIPYGWVWIEIDSEKDWVYPVK